MVNRIPKTNDATFAAFCVKHYIQRLSLFGSQLEAVRGLTAILTSL
jgi:hypothetical protein